MAIKRKLARKAVKTTAKHTAHGTVSRLMREPARVMTLVGLGAVAGALFGWIVGRKGRSSGPDNLEPVSPPIPSVPVSGGVA